LAQRTCEELLFKPARRIRARESALRQSEEAMDDCLLGTISNKMLIGWCGGAHPPPHTTRHSACNIPKSRRTLRNDRSGFFCTSYKSGTVALLFFGLEPKRIEAIREHFRALLDRHAESRKDKKWKIISKSSRLLIIRPR